MMEMLLPQCPLTLLIVSPLEGMTYPSPECMRNIAPPEHINNNPSLHITMKNNVFTHHSERTRTIVIHLWVPTTFYVYKTFQKENLNSNNSTTHSEVNTKSDNI